MKVNELIEKLKEYPQDLTVVFEWQRTWNAPGTFKILDVGDEEDCRKLLKPTLKIEIDNHLSQEEKEELYEYIPWSMEFEDEYEDRVVYGI